MTYIVSSDLGDAMPRLIPFGGFSHDPVTVSSGGLLACKRAVGLAHRVSARLGSLH